MESLLKFKIQLFYNDDILQDKDKARLLEDNLKIKIGASQESLKTFIFDISRLKMHYYYI